MTKAVLYDFDETLQDRTKAVSYTHLDVYKRQQYVSAALAPSEVCEVEILDEDAKSCRATAVSYTHLDVYKRQGVGRLVKEKCDVTVSLPMCGKVNSLNASVAGSIITVSYTHLQWFVVLYFISG